MAEHTATPWRVSRTHPGGQFRVSSAVEHVGDTAQLRSVATVYLAADADFVSKACNSHDDLVAALKAALLSLEIDAGCEEGEFISSVKSVDLRTGKPHFFDAEAAYAALEKAGASDAR